MRGGEAIDKLFLSCIFPVGGIVMKSVWYTKPVSSFASRYNSLEASGLQDE